MRLRTSVWEVLSVRSSVSRSVKRRIWTFLIVKCYEKLSSTMMRQSDDDVLASDVPPRYLFYLSWYVVHHRGSPWCGAICLWNNFHLSISIHSSFIYPTIHYQPIIILHSITSNSAHFLLLFDLTFGIWPTKFGYYVDRDTTETSIFWLFCFSLLGLKRTGEGCLTDNFRNKRPKTSMHRQWAATQTHS